MSKTTTPQNENEIMWNLVRRVTSAYAIPITGLEFQQGVYTFNAYGICGLYLRNVVMEPTNRNNLEHRVWISHRSHLECQPSARPYRGLVDCELILPEENMTGEVQAYTDPAIKNYLNFFLKKYADAQAPIPSGPECNGTEKSAFVIDLALTIEQFETLAR